MVSKVLAVKFAVATKGLEYKPKKTASRKVSLNDFPTSSDSDTESQAQPPLQKQFSNPLE